VKTLKRVAKRKVSCVRRIVHKAGLAVADVFGVGVLEIASHSLPGIWNAGASVLALVVALAVMVAAWAAE
jgi:hypothetical protein